MSEQAALARRLGVGDALNCASLHGPGAGSDEYGARLLIRSAAHMATLLG